MSVQEIKSQIEDLPAEERRQLAAFLVTLRHKDMADRIDDSSPGKWLTLEECDQRLGS